MNAIKQKQIYQSIKGKFTKCYLKVSCGPNSLISEQMVDDSSMTKMLYLKTMFAYKSIECLYQLLKSRHLIVRSISLIPYLWYFKLGIMGKKEKK